MLYDKDELNKELGKRIEFFKNEIKKISTGKPNVDAIESVEVDAYGTVTRIQAVGQVTVEDAISVKISVWDRSILQAVEKAMRESDLGAGVFVEGDGIRLRFNPITGEDRERRVRDLGILVEEEKIKIRLVRQDFRKKLDTLEGVSEDEVKRDEEEIQKQIDKAIEEIDSIAAQKEIEIRKV